MNYYARLQNRLPEITLEYDSCLASLARLDIPRPLLETYPLVTDEPVNHVATEFWYLCERKQFQTLILPRSTQPELWRSPIDYRRGAKWYLGPIKNDRDLIGTLLSMGVIDKAFVAQPYHLHALLEDTLSGFGIWFSPRVGKIVSVPEDIFEENTRRELQAKMFSAAHYGVNLFKLLARTHEPPVEVVQELQRQAQLFEGRFLARHAPELLEKPPFDRIHSLYQMAGLSETDYAVPRPSCANFYRFKTV